MIFLKIDFISKNSSEELFGGENGTHIWKDVGCVSLGFVRAFILAFQLKTSLTFLLKYGVQDEQRHLL